MPAAAVIRRMQALSGFIGFKGSADGLKLEALSAVAAGGTRGVAVKCIDITKNPDCEGSLPVRD